MGDPSKIRVSDFKEIETYSMLTEVLESSKKKGPIYLNPVKPTEVLFSDATEALLSTVYQNIVIVNLDGTNKRRIR